MASNELDRIDAEVIRQLQIDARMPVSTIAERIDVPESTVRNRLARMISSGVLELSAWVNPEELNHRVWVMIDLSVDMRQIDTIAQQLADIPQIYYIGIATGAHDIHAAAVFRSNDEFIACITGPIAAIDGINRTMTSTIIKQIKRTHRYSDPARLVKNMKEPARPRGGSRDAPPHPTRRRV
ncbi:MAG: Lrp/AsnC family transcriptional regulator [Lautropia sp.]